MQRKLLTSFTFFRRSWRNPYVRVRCLCFVLGLKDRQKIDLVVNYSKSVLDSHARSQTHSITSFFDNDGLHTSSLWSSSGRCKWRVGFICILNGFILLDFPQMHHGASWTIFAYHLGHCRRLVASKLPLQRRYSLFQHIACVLANIFDAIDELLRLYQPY